MKNESIRLELGWKNALKSEFSQEYMRSLKLFLQNEIEKKKKIYPAGSEYFAALNLAPFDHVKVAILGQDPYHGIGQAHGLCFSVRKGVRIPPSLVNIYKEIKADIGITQPAHGNLEGWARQGVLLLNSVLTVEHGRPASHQNRGWEKFTDQIVARLNERKTPVAFVLWGSYAQKKGRFIDDKKHLVLKSAHPSPLSAYNGFFGCRHFSKINSFLMKNGIEPINWQLEE